jgi:hypothetical protein
VGHEGRLRLTVDAVHERVGRSPIAIAGSAQERLGKLLAALSTILAAQSRAVMRRARNLGLCSCEHCAGPSSIGGRSAVRKVGKTHPGYRARLTDGDPAALSRRSSLRSARRSAAGWRRGSSDSGRRRWPVEVRRGGATAVYTRGVTRGVTRVESSPPHETQKRTETRMASGVAESPLTDSNRRPPPYHRSLAAQFGLQIRPLRARAMRRETSRVSFLMCPFCVRALMPSEATYVRASQQRPSGWSPEHREDAEDGFARTCAASPGRPRAR